MTSRLKKKLDNLEEQGNNLNESFCLIGTPLPSLADSKRDKNEFVPVWKQEVRDEQGRRRFHGAFTGGFSAGYYNTVGSKEGWTPSTFVSSRDQRAKKSQAVEDFMDDEDLEDLKNSRQLENTDTFKGGDGFGTAAELGARGEEGSLSSALNSLIQPSTSSIGQKLLVKMGWKPGQGIGPRLTARQLKLQERKIGRRAAHVGSNAHAGPTTDLDGEDDDMMDDSKDKDGKKHTFAPRDTKLLLFDNKQDRSGLGFNRGGGMDLPGTGVNRSKVVQDEQNISSGFGLGGHDADEDDFDIYSPGPSSLRGPSDGRRTAYDRDEDDEMADGVVLLGDGAVGSGRIKTGLAKTTGRQRPDDKRSNRSSGAKAAAGYQWHDGRPVIPGFVVDIKVFSNDKWFPFPDIPEGWRPRPARVWQTNRKWDQGPVRKPEPVIPPTGRNRLQMTADERGQALGEAQLETPAKSIFDYMSAKSKERLAQVIPADRKPALGADLGEDPVEEAAPMAEGVVVPPLSPRTASAALKGFIPFGDDLAKQERYTSYLRSQTHDTKEPNPKLFPTGQLDHVNKELSDFSKSAQMFRPLSFAMANRFTSSKMSTQDMVQPKPGLHVPDPNKVNEWKDKTKLEEEIKEVLTPREEAARAGLYGKMTRITSDWVPHALLCKRFGVANPWPDGPPGSKPADGDAEAAAPAAQTGRALGTKPLLTGPGQDVAWQSNFVHQTPKPAAEKEEETLAPGEVPQERQPRSIVEVGLAEDVNQGRDTLTYKKPEMNIFRAIFASDDEDDEDDEEIESEERQLTATLPTSAIASTITASTSATAPITSLPSANIPIASDIARPVFSSSASRAASNSEASSKRASSKKDKKRDRVKAKTMLSFDVGDDDEQDPGVPNEESRDRKRRRKEEKHETKPIKIPAEPKITVADDDDEWVEAPVVGRANKEM